jgi:hypothetical protein
VLTNGDGRRYELLDGALAVSPRPTTVYQVVAGRLYGVLSSVCSEDLCVVPVPSYWIVNPDPPQPELTAFELRDGRYALAAETSGSFATDRPFAVTVTPVGLTRGLRH